jgi:protein O-mannosyl-transferase
MSSNLVTPSEADRTVFTAPIPEARRVALAAGGLSLIVLVVAGYWPSLRGGFVWDDLVLVSRNPLAAGELNLRTVWLGTDFPLSTVTTWLEWLAFGNNPIGYRLINILLHSLSAVLAWRCLARLKIPGAWLGAALFAVHPVAVASVAWISELKNTLSLPFFLLSGWAFWVFEDESKAEHSTKARRFYALSLAAFFLALLAKTSTVLLPVVLLAGVWWRNRTVTKQNLRQVSPHFALALVFGLLTIWFQSQQAIRGVAVQSEDFLGRLAAAGHALWFYLGKTLLPVKLSMIYPRWETTTPIGVAFLPLLLWVTVLVVAWRFRTGWGRSVLISLSCFTALLFPVLGFFDMYFMVFARVSDHLAYLALLAITPLVAAVVNLLPDRRIARTVGALLLALLTVFTWERAKVFTSDELLWRDTIAKNPRAWNAYNNLGCNLAERGELAAAIKDFETSIALNPRNADAHRNLGKALALTGRFSAAEPHLHTALDLKPNDAETLVTYATCLAENRRTVEAIELLRQAISIKPDVHYRLQLAPLLAATGNYAAAAEAMQAVLDVQPDSFEALNNLAWIRATCPDNAVRDGAAAVRLAKEACRISANQQPVPFGTLAAAYAETGDFTNAVAAAQTAIDLATAAGNTPFATMNRQLQQLYRAGQPLHTPPPKR